ncbi:MAG: TonB family protein [Polyangiaceae bacterium]
MRRLGRLAIALWVLGAPARALAQAESGADPGEPHAAPSNPAGSQPPQILSRSEPVYPPQRIAEEHSTATPLPEVDVEVEVALDASGTVTDVRVIASQGPDFDNEAMAAARSFTYAPATLNGEPVASKLHIPIHFEPPPHPADEHEQVQIIGRKPPPVVGASDYRIEVGELKAVPRQGSSAAQLLKLAPSIFLMKDGGGEGHAERVYLRGFDAREGQDIEFSVGGVPINEAGNYHGNGYSDLNFIIPELVTRLRVLEGPFDPRQGNFAVAGSADYELGLVDRGLTAQISYGSFNTTRGLLLWGPSEESTRTFAAAEVFYTDGYGQNRDAIRARAMGQYEGSLGANGSFRVQGAGYFTQYHSAGLLREDDVESGRVGFYDTMDPNQGGGGMRFHLSADFEGRYGDTTYGLQIFGVYRSMSLRENYTGFLEDPQLARQQPHEQRGDLLDLAMTEGTLGLRANGRHSFKVLGLKQDLEAGLFARGDIVSSLAQRLEATTNAPYRTDADFDSKLADIGLYADAALRFAPWLTLRGGVRVDVFAYDVQDNCAIKDVSRPSTEDPPGDASCLSQTRFGAHREPNTHSTTASIRPMPRVSLQIGPFEGVSFSAAYGQGTRSIDPAYITQDVATPFASIDSGEVGASYIKGFGDVSFSAQSVFFATHVDRDQIFNQTEGRATLAEGTTRAGWAGSVRVAGDWIDVSTNITLVESRFDDTGLVVPYVPDLVIRHDGALFHDLFDIDGSPVRGRIGLGAGYIGRRALPYGQRSDMIFTLDASIGAKWRFLNFDIQGTNLLDLQYREAEFNYVSDFDPSDPASLVPARHFAAGAPLTILATLSGTLGGV